MGDSKQMVELTEEQMLDTCGGKRGKKGGGGSTNVFIINFGVIGAIVIGNGNHVRVNIGD